MTLKIEEGKFYRTRDGRKVGPMRKSLWETKLFDLSYHDDPSINACLWDEDGCADEGRNLDLIAEWSEEPEALDLTAITTPFGFLPPETQKALRDHGGPWEFWNGWEWAANSAPAWSGEYAYRVKPYTEPREWWIVGDCEAYASEAEALEAASTLFGDAKPVHVREVKE